MEMRIRKATRNKNVVRAKTMQEKGQKIGTVKVEGGTKGCRLKEEKWLKIKACGSEQKL